MFTQLFAQVYGVSLPQFAEAGAALEARKNVLGEVMERELVAGRKLLVDDRVGAFDMLTWRLLDTEIVPAFGGHLGLSVFGGVDEVGDASRRAELLAGVGGGTMIFVRGTIIPQSGTPAERSRSTSPTALRWCSARS